MTPSEKKAMTKRKEEGLKWWHWFLIGFFTYHFIGYHHIDLISINAGVTP